jgi:hypothetical protein
VRRAEGIHDEDVAERGHLPASASSSFFSPLLKRTFSHSTTSPAAQSTPSSQSR